MPRRWLNSSWWQAETGWTNKHIPATAKVVVLAAVLLWWAEQQARHIDVQHGAIRAFQLLRQHAVAEADPAVKLGCHRYVHALPAGQVRLDGSGRERKVLQGLAGKERGRMRTRIVGACATGGK